MAAPLTPRSKAMIANAMPSIVQTPAASPSTPSEKLTTFIIPTSQMTVSDTALVGELQRAHERDRDPGHDGSRLDRDHRRDDLSDQLDPRPQRANVVDRADERDQAGAGDHAPHMDGAAGTALSVRDMRQVDRTRQPDRRRHQHPGEDREPAEQRRLAQRQPTFARHVDRAHPSRQPRRDAASTPPLSPARPGTRARRRAASLRSMPAVPDCRFKGRIPARSAPARSAPRSRTARAPPGAT